MNGPAIASKVAGTIRMKPESHSGLEVRKSMPPCELLGKAPGNVPAFRGLRQCPETLHSVFIKNALNRHVGGPIETSPRLRGTESRRNEIKIGGSRDRDKGLIAQATVSRGASRCVNTGDNYDR